ncbi:hypothetical protein, partial [Actinobacillus pleuropneumoniae]|uniref:hypothetical protein n=1 Tax=Actinobacillus pleuropneumoniae TaxID=715 RepID=UPI00227B2FD8
AHRKQRILFMCTPTFALHLVGVQNTTVVLLKNGMWMQKILIWSSLAALNIEAEFGSGIGASSSSAPPSTVEHCAASIFYEDCYDED